jgi:hypothetical protein
LIANPSVRISGGKQQTYLQHRPGGGAYKLIVGVSDRQAASTNKDKDYKQLVGELHPYSQRDGATQGSSLEARPILLKKYEK